MTEALGRSFASLQIPNFRRYFTGQLVSLSGNWMQTIAEIWLILSLTGSGLAVGITTALQFLPMLIFGAWGGLIADRVPKRSDAWLCSLPRSSSFAVEKLAGQPRVRADAVLDRWAGDPDVWLRRASLMASLRGLGSGGGDWDGFVRRAKIATDLPLARTTPAGTTQGRATPDMGPDQEAIAAVLDAVAERRPELRLTFRH